MAYQWETPVGRETVAGGHGRGRQQTSRPGANGALSQRAPGTARQAPPKESSLFNQGDPGPSFCDLPAADVSEMESDQPYTVDVEKFADLMLFPELMDVFEGFPAFEDFPVDPLGELAEPLKPRDPLPSLASVSTADDGGEASPAESDASVDHFFNTFTDLTGFLQQLTEEAGPSDLTDLAAAITECNDPLTTYAELSATPTTPPPPTTPVGPETATQEAPAAAAAAAADPGRSPPSEEGDGDDAAAPPAKKARRAAAGGHRGPGELDAEAKYRRRRDKNNIASQRSRASRKQRETEMAGQAEALEADNARLRLRIEELEAIAEEARKCLVAALSQK